MRLTSDTGFHPQLCDNTHFVDKHDFFESRLRSMTTFNASNALYQF